MRERPAFRSTLAKHALDGGRGICRARPRHKALLGKPGGASRRDDADAKLDQRQDAKLLRHQIASEAAGVFNDHDANAVAFDPVEKRRKPRHRTITPKS